MTPPGPGDIAPDFELPGADGNLWRLSSLKGRRVIVYFYPADDTPGCTEQACDFRDARDDLERGGYVILGISPQGSESHRAFSARYGLSFPLLTDSDLSVARRYGAVRAERGFHGDVPLDVARSTFVIDEDGKIVHALRDVRATGHVDALKDLLEPGRVVE